MGTQEEEREWMDVAKALLVKCDISLRLRKVTDCDACVFVRLYEAILGENVPDHIASPKSQEDDIHNVQSVIDSLALDYLQISLSHITGENIVKGDKYSIRNLLEIFDGLLDYLTEQISEEESLTEEHGGEDIPNKSGPLTSQPTEPMDTLSEKMSRLSTDQSDVQSSKHSEHSCDVEETESTELIRLGDSARTFTANQEVNPLFQATDQSTSEPPKDQREPLNSAIPLRPPYQASPHRLGQHTNSQRHRAENATSVWAESCRQEGDTIDADGLHSNAQRHSPTDCERSVSGIPKASSRVSSDQEEDRKNGITPLDMDEEEYEDEEGPEDVGVTFGQQDNWAHWENTAIDHGDRIPAEPLSWRRQKNRQAEQELHQMSEKLSQRLEELDQMLQRALGGSAESGESPEEDKRSFHIFNGTDCQRTRTPAGTAQSPIHYRSPSSSGEHSLVERKLEGAMTEVSIGKARSLKSLTAVHTHRREKGQLHGQHGGEAYEEELRSYEERKQTDLDKERLKAQEAEREYRETILKDAPRTPKPSRSRSSAATSPSGSPRPGRRVSRGSKKASQMNVKDNDLLYKLLEEFPHLSISQRALNQMRIQQLGQVEQLQSLQDLHKPRNYKLTSQVEEARRKHNLLMEILGKEQQHNKRLRDHRDRIHQQKMPQRRLREQRQQIALAKKYHQDYHVQLRTRLIRARTKDERMFKKVFEEGLAIQKECLREQRARAKEQRLEHQKRQQDQIQSMENYYKDQFSLLAETLAQERQEIHVRKRAQEKALQKMKRELRTKMERELSELQKIIIQNDDEDHFRELEVERLRSQVQMASFQYNTSCLH